MLTDVQLQRIQSWAEGASAPVAMRARIQGEDVPMWVPSGVCVLPTGDIYVVQLGQARATTITTIREAYARIHNLAVSKQALKDQRQAWQKFFGDVPSKEKLWTNAMTIASLFGLPVAIVLFGESQSDGSPISILQAMVPAPLDMALATIQRTTGLFG